MGDDSKNWAAITGFVVSLAGLFILGILLGAIAVVFSAIGLKSNKRGLAIAGLVIGIVDIVVSLIIFGL